MSEFSKEVGREFKGLLTVGIYLLAFAIAVFYRSAFSSFFKMLWGGFSFLGSKLEHFLPHIIAVLCTIVASLCINWFLYRRQRLELHALIGIIYEAFYGAFRPEEGTIYRVSCYRYHDWSGYWYLRHFLNVTKKRRDRRPLQGISFLECVARHGHEGRKPVRRRTTLTMAVSPEKTWSEGFAGLVAREQRTLKRQIEEDINLAVGKIKPMREGVNLREMRERLWKKVQEGEHGAEGVVAWEGVEECYNLEALTDDERESLRKFITQTNTTPFLLLSVRGGKKHCNHFFGFPVFRRDQLWGVVTIDALDKNFYMEMTKRVNALLGSGSAEREAVDHWIDGQLKLFAKIFDDFVQVYR